MRAVQRERDSYHPLRQGSDRAARRRLIELCRGGLEVDQSRLDGVLDHTDGVTASFLEEFLRRSADVAGDRQPPTANPSEPGTTGAVQVSADDFDAAPADLLNTRNQMTRAVLGFSPDTDPATAPSNPRMPGPQTLVIAARSSDGAIELHQYRPASPRGSGNGITSTLQLGATAQAPALATPALPRQLREVGEVDDDGSWSETGALR